MSESWTQAGSSSVALAGGSRRAATKVPYHASHLRSIVTTMKDPFIAVVDDDPSVRKALERLLRTAHMEVLTYSSAEKFLVTLDDRHPDCLVLDIRMPGMTGLDLRDRLASLSLRIPIVFITAHAPDLDTEEGAFGEPAAILHKPFDDEILLEAIGRCIRSNEAR